MGVLKNISKFHRKTPVLEFLFNKFANFLRTPFLQNNSGSSFWSISCQYSHFRSIYQRCSLKMVFLKTFCCRPVILFKKRLWHRCFLANFAKFLRTRFFTEHLRETASATAICFNFFQHSTLKEMRVLK